MGQTEKMIRTARLLAIGVAMGLTCWAARVEAGLFDPQRDAKPQMIRLAFEEPALAPVAFTRFCLRYPEDCRARRMAFRRPAPLKLSKQRLRDLIDVNQDVNASIVPQANEFGLLRERWQLFPDRGACYDYAVTKRHELLNRGWPSRALLLAEVATVWGEHHLVLVARTQQGDLVLDNLTDDIRFWARAPYRWIRIQLPHDPKIWATIRNHPLDPMNAEAAGRRITISQ